MKFVVEFVNKELWNYPIKRSLVTRGLRSISDLIISNYGNCIRGDETIQEIMKAFDCSSKCYASLILEAWHKARFWNWCKRRNVSQEKDELQC